MRLSSRVAAVLALAGVAHAQLQFEPLRKRHLPAMNVVGASAFAAGDVDGDGDQDLVVGTVSGAAVPTRLYLNDGSGIFVDATEGRMPADGSVSGQVVLADVDGDGDPDLVLARAGQDRLYLNDGTGTFQDATVGHLPTLSADSLSVVVLDADHDGDEDLVFGGTFRHPSRLYLNDGTGVFAHVPAGLPAFTGTVAGLRAADVDGDGVEDLLLRTPQRPPGSVRLWLNDGSGRFLESTWTRLPQESYVGQGLALDDVDGDGDEDIALCTSASSHLYENDGTGRFTDVSTSRLPSTSGGARSTALGDVDGDGDPDLVFGTTDGRTLLLSNDGTGTFTDVTAARLPARTRNGAVVGASSDVLMVDVDGDADLDLVLAIGGEAALYLNDGRGYFTDASAGDVPDSRFSAEDLALGDVDGDGDPDLLVATAGQQEDLLYLNDGTGRFEDATATRLPFVALNTTSVELGDVDGDADLDVVFGNIGPPGQRFNRLYLNDGTGRFTVASTSRLPLDDDVTFAVLLEDVDDDDDLDLVTGNSGRQNRLYLNDGAGTFTDATAGRMPIDADTTLSLAFGDVDGDGDPDLVVGNSGRTRNRLYVNDGVGVFTDVSTGRMPPDTDSTRSIALVDVDDDGDPDLVMGNGGGQDRLYVNDGAGTFTDDTGGRLPLRSGGTMSVAAGDVDGDGDPDLIVGNGSGQDWLYLNDGTGVFTDATAGRLPAGDGRTRCAALFDTDGDGDADLVFGGGLTTRVYRNLLRQLATPHLARVGRSFRLDVYARYGPWRWSDVAFAFVSDARASIPLPPAGTVGIDPSRAFSFPPLLVPRPEGVASMSIAVPDIAALVGTSIHAQVVLVQLPDDIWLTNVTTDELTVR